MGQASFSNGPYSLNLIRRVAYLFVVDGSKVRLARS